MKKGLLLFLVAVSITAPAFKEIDTFIEQGSKLLVTNESIDTFNIESFYKIKC